LIHQCSAARVASNGSMARDYSTDLQGVLLRAR
jgi:hypothetical protein